MDNRKIAREIQSLGVPWSPGMADQSGNRAVEIYEDEDLGTVIITVSEYTNGEESKYEVGFVHHPSLGSFDLTDPATVGVIENYIRKLWFDLGAQWVDIMHGRSTYGVFVRFCPQRGMDKRDWATGGAEPAKAMLAALKEAKERSQRENG